MRRDVSDVCCFASKRNVHTSTRGPGDLASANSKNKMKSVLIVCTSADKLETIGTGCWAEEIAAPYYAFIEAGFSVTVASILGGEVPMDDASLNPPYLTKEAEKFILDDAAMQLVSESKPISSIDFLAYDAIFLPGGHGTCVDFPTSEPLIKGLAAAYSAGKVVSAVCHGPTGLVNVMDENGQPIVKGKKVTGFSDTEEVAVGKDHLVPFMLEARLKELGGVYSKADNWHPYAVIDGNLVTGQNPQSSKATADLVVKALSS